MNEYEEYKREQEEKRWKEDQRRRVSTIRRWTDDPERFKEQILFETDPEELLSILSELKEAKPHAHQFILDFQLIWSLFRKSDKQIKSFIAAHNLTHKLEYFTSICQNEHDQLIRELLNDSMTYRKLDKKRDEVEIAKLKEKLENDNGVVWKNLIRIFTELKGKSDAERHEQLNRTNSLMPEFTQRLTDVEKFLRYEKILISKGYFSQNGKKLTLEKDAQDLAAWGVFLVKEQLVKNLPLPSKSKNGFNFSKLADILHLRYDGYNVSNLKNKLSPSRYTEIANNYKELENLLRPSTKKK